MAHCSTRETLLIVIGQFQLSPILSGIGVYSKFLVTSLNQFGLKKVIAAHVRFIQSGALWIIMWLVALW